MVADSGRRSVAIDRVAGPFVGSTMAALGRRTVSGGGGEVGRLTASGGSRLWRWIESA
jgi:hypothetical protein